MLFFAAKRTGVERIVHLSITLACRLACCGNA